MTSPSVGGRKPQMHFISTVLPAAVVADDPVDPAGLKIARDAVEHALAPKVAGQVFDADGRFHRYPFSVPEKLKP